jgi:hypothetical protein
MTRGLALLMVAVLTPSSIAADTGPVATCCDARSCCTCCDNYCPKLLPCVPCAPRGCCDSYCPKPMPWTKPLCYCGPNDYCPKPCIYVPPCWPAWYSCGAQNSGTKH